MAKMIMFFRLLGQKLVSTGYIKITFTMITTTSLILYMKNTYKTEEEVEKKINKLEHGNCIWLKMNYVY